MVNVVRALILPPDTGPVDTYRAVSCTPLTLADGPTNHWFNVLATTESGPKFATMPSCRICTPTPWAVDAGASVSVPVRLAGLLASVRGQFKESPREGLLAFSASC
jgi:hypothetical protein